MAIIKQYHADTDTTYVYESTSYWDSEKKQSRSKRKLLGKLDPQTGDIIPTGTRGRKKKESNAEVQDTSATDALKIQELMLNLSLKEARIAELEKENQALKNQFISIRKSLESSLSLCTKVIE